MMGEAKAEVYLSGRSSARKGTSNNGHNSDSEGGLSQNYLSYAWYSANVTKGLL